MSRSSLEKIKVVAYMLCEYAMQNDIINKNYASFVRLPKSIKEEKQAFTDPEIKKMFDNDKCWTDTILMLIHLGMRINEFLGITRFDVHLDEQYIIGGNKTEAGKGRIIPIHPKIIEYVRKWYNYGGNYLICNDKGQAITDKAYRAKYYYPGLERLGIRKLNPHCCRHTFASLMAKAGADTFSIQRILGHTKYSFTADTYTHTDIEGLKKAISQI